MVYAEALKVLNAKVFEQFLLGRLRREGPIFQFEDVILRREEVLRVSELAALHEHLLGREIAEQFVDIIGRSLGHEKFAGRKVEKTDSYGGFVVVDGAEEVVFAAVEGTVAHDDARGHEFGDAAFHELLGQFGVFELVANGDAFAGANESRQIGVEGVEGEAGHFDFAHFSLV